ncbi:MAG: MFS transporter [Oscillospiraceae bacterium]
MQKLLSKNRWVIMAAAISIQVCTSFPALWAVFQQSAADTYGITLAQSAMVFPMCTAFYGVFSIIGGKMQDTMSPRVTCIIGSVFMSGGVIALALLGEGTNINTLYLAFSMPFGGGCGLIFPAMINPVMKWYADKKGFAMGTSGAVATGILVIMTYLSKTLLGTWGMKKTVFIYGISFLVVSLISCIFFENPTDEYIKEKTALSKVGGKGAKARPVVDFTPREMLKTNQYYLLLAAGICAAPAYMLIAPSIVTMGVSRGLDINQAVSAVALATGTSAIGKFIIPTLSDKIGRKKCAVIFLSITLVLSVLLMRAGGTSLLIIYPAMVCAHGGWAMLITPFGNDMFGFKNAGTNSGLVSIYSTVSAFAGPILVGVFTPLLFEHTNHYIAIAGVGVAVICIALLNPDTSKIKDKWAENSAK